MCQKTVKRGTVPKGPSAENVTDWHPFKSGSGSRGPHYTSIQQRSRSYSHTRGLRNQVPWGSPPEKDPKRGCGRALMETYSWLDILAEGFHDQGTYFLCHIVSCLCHIACWRWAACLAWSIANDSIPPQEQWPGWEIQWYPQSNVESCVRRTASTVAPVPGSLTVYREVPQSSNGFAQFVFLYGRELRGPMGILRKLWTGERIVPP